MKEKLPESWKYKKGERTKMLKAGFPLCLGKHHCGACIKNYRLTGERSKTSAWLKEIWDKRTK